MPVKKLHIIYVPGLGDHKVDGQLWAVQCWRKRGIEAELFQMKWGDQEPWEPKFERLLLTIDRLLDDSKDVALVGASAGASAVINAFTARKDHLVGVVCIAGKINRPDAIGSRYYREAPAFVTSAKQCEIALTHLASDDRDRILSRYGLYDETVSRVDSIVPGAKNQTVLAISHYLTIATQITLGAPSFIRWLKRLQSSQSEVN